ncbi:carbohydrate porin [Aporhodopirellula rubra]|uniref:carbohydrate porin n=1 Tax=Aporhodopirellula rubra TaxID=980271 RepID=UPI0028F3F15F|nr:carbohydrate porin [Aporhodopirellula rubra]
MTRSQETRTRCCRLNPTSESMRSARLAVCPDGPNLLCDVVHYVELEPTQTPRGNRCFRLPRVLRIYGHVDVEVARNLTVFCFASNSEHDEVVKTLVQISCGINGKGMCPGRADDHTMCFATYGELSDDDGDSIGEEVDHEIVYERGHRFQLLPAAYVQPALRYIVNPSGTGNIANRTVLGAWGGAPF